LGASRFVGAPELSGCVIVSGMPGAGKSTVTARAARLLARAAQVKGDDVNHIMKQHAVFDAERPDLSEAPSERSGAWTFDQKLARGQAGVAWSP
jgi:Mrp family chromosome partitioning ATPase